MNSTKIFCPSCNTEIDVSEAVYHQVRTEMERNYSSDFKARNEALEKDRQMLEKEKKQLEKSKQQENELIEESVAAKLKQEKIGIEAQVKARIENEKSDEIATMQQELNEKSEKLKEFNKAQAEILRLKREKEELAFEITAQSTKQFNQQLTVEVQRVQEQERNNHQLKIKELEKKLHDQEELTNEMKRKQEQGSVQLQGEVQELGIEEFLRSTFPLDTIVEVKKGARGADCKQIINSRQKENCGVIYYESKRTKEFGSGWIEKFNADIREIGANVGILVTDVMPADMQRMGLKDGVWICTFNEFKGMCGIIRDYIIKLDCAIASQENKGEKMQMLYDYLTSHQFKARVEGILESHRQMYEDLQAEKRSLMSHWKRREKQLEKVLMNTSDIYSSIHGIAGKAIQTIEALEFTTPTAIEQEIDLFQ